MSTFPVFVQTGAAWESGATRAAGMTRESEMSGTERTRTQTPVPSRSPTNKERKSNNAGTPAAFEPAGSVGSAGTTGGGGIVDSIVPGTVGPPAVSTAFTTQAFPADSSDFGGSGDSASVLRYRRYRAPAERITDILAGQELYIPFRKDEFQRWAAILEKKQPDTVPVFASGERLVRTVLEATLDGRQLVDGTGRFEFRNTPGRHAECRRTNESPGRSDTFSKWCEFLSPESARFRLSDPPATPTRIAFAPLGIWIDSLRWWDGTPATLIASRNGRIELVDHVPFRLGSRRPFLVPTEKRDEIFRRAVLALLDDTDIPGEPAREEDAKHLTASAIPPDTRLTFRWSLHARQESSGALFFDFELPASLVVELRVRLPEHLIPECPNALIFEEEEAAQAEPGESTESPARQTARSWRIVLNGAQRFRLALLSSHSSIKGTAIGFHQKQVWVMDQQGVDVTAGFTFDQTDHVNNSLVVDLDAPLRPVDVLYGTRSVPWSIVEEPADPDELAPDTPGTPVAANKRTKKNAESDTKKTRIRIALDGTAPSDASELQIVAQCRIPLDRRFDLPRIRVVSEQFFHRETLAVLTIARPLLVRRLEAFDASQTLPGSAFERPGRDVYAFQFFNADSRLAMELTKHLSSITWSSLTSIDSATNEMNADTTAEFYVSEGIRYTLRAKVNPGWVVDTIKSLGPNEIVDWDFQQENGRFSVQWKKPLTSGEPVRMQIKSRFQRPPERIILDSLRPLRLDDETGVHLIALESVFPYRFQSKEEIPYPTAASFAVPVFLRSIMEHSDATVIPLDEETRNRQLLRESSKSTYNAEIGGEIVFTNEEVRQAYTIHCSPLDGPVDRVLVCFTGTHETRDGTTGNGKTLIRPERQPGRPSPEQPEGTPVQRPSTAHSEITSADRPETAAENADGEWKWSIQDESESAFQVVPVSFEAEPYTAQNASTPDSANSGRISRTDTPVFSAWEIRFAAPRGTPFDLSVSRTVRPNGDYAIPLAILPRATRQHAELSVQSDSAPMIRLINNRLESIPYFVAPGNTRQPILAMFRYDPKKELESHPVAALLFSPMHSSNSVPENATVEADDVSPREIVVPGNEPRPVSRDASRSQSDSGRGDDVPNCRAWSLQLDSQFQPDGMVRNNAVFLIENNGRESIEVCLPPLIEREGIFAIWIDDTRVLWQPPLDDPDDKTVRISVDLPPNRRFLSISVEYGYRSRPLTRQRRLRPQYPQIDIPVLSGSWTTWFPPEFDVNIRSRNANPSRGYESRILAMRWMLGSFDPLSPNAWSRLLWENREHTDFENLGRRIVENLGRANEVPDSLELSGQDRETHAGNGPYAENAAPGNGVPSGNREYSGPEPTWGDWFYAESRRQTIIMRERSDSGADEQRKWSDLLFRIDRRAFDRLGVGPSLPLAVPKEGTALEKGFRVLEKNGLALILVKGGDATAPDTISVLFTSALTAAKCRPFLQSLVGERVWLFVPPSNISSHHAHGTNSALNTGASISPAANGRAMGDSRVSTHARFGSTDSTLHAAISPLSRFFAFLPADCEWVAPTNWMEESSQDNNPWESVRQEIRFSSATSGWTAIEISRGDAERSLSIVHRNTIATYGGIMFLALFLLTWRRPLSHPLILLLFLLSFEIIARNIPACYAPIPGGAFLGTLCSLGFSLVRSSTRRTGQMIRRQVLNRSVITAEMHTGRQYRFRSGSATGDSDSSWGFASSGESDGSSRASGSGKPGGSGSSTPRPAPRAPQLSPTVTYTETSLPIEGNNPDLHSVITSTEINETEINDTEIDGPGQPPPSVKENSVEGDSAAGRLTDADSSRESSGSGERNAKPDGEPPFFASFFFLFVPFAVLLLTGLHFAVHGQTTLTMDQSLPGPAPGGTVRSPTTFVGAPGSSGGDTHFGADVSATVVPSSRMPSSSSAPSSTTPGAVRNDPHAPERKAETIAPNAFFMGVPRGAELGPPPYKVYVPVDGNNEPVGDHYWISEEFLRRLYQGVRRESVSGQRWGIRRAEYYGTLLSNPVRQEYTLSNFRAIFDVELEEETATLHLPFVPESMRWDRTPIQPTWQRDERTATPEGRNDESLVFAVENQRPGTHQLELTLQPSIEKTEELNRLLLRIPKVPGALLRLITPPDMPAVQVEETLGAIHPNGPTHPQAVIELGATDRLDLSWPEQPGEDAETSVDQLFLLRIQPNKEVELQAIFRYYLGNAKTRHLYIATDPDLQLSGPYRLFVNTQPSDLIESVTEATGEDVFRTGSNPAVTRITLKAPLGGLVSVRADYVVKNFGGIGSLSLPHLSSVKSKIGKSWLAIWADPALQCELSGAAIDPDVLRNFPILWTIPVSPTPSSQDTALWGALALDHVPPGTLLSIRKTAPPPHVHWNHALLFSESQIRVQARASVSATGETFQYGLRVPAGFQVEDVRFADADGNPCEARWILSLPDAAEPTGPGNENTKSDYGLFLKKPISGNHTLSVHGRMPVERTKAKSETEERASQAVPLLTLNDTIISEESISLFRTSEVVARFAGPVSEWSSMETTDATNRFGFPNDPGHANGAEYPGGANDPGHSRQAELFPLASPFARAIFLGTYTRLVGKEHSLEEGEGRARQENRAGGAPRARTAEPTVPSSRSRTAQTARSNRAPVFQLDRNLPTMSGTRVSSLYRRFKEEPSGTAANPSDASRGGVGGASGAEGMERAGRTGNAARNTGTGVGIAPGNVPGGISPEKTNRESTWELLSTFDVNVEQGEIDRFVIRFDKNCRAIGVLDAIDFVVENRENESLLVLKPAVPVSGRFTVSVCCEVGTLADSVALPHIAPDMERTNLRHYIVLPTEFLAERFEWKVEQLVPTEPEIARKVLANDTLFIREEIDRTDPESLEDHRGHKVVYTVTGPEYRAVIRAADKGAEITLADLTLYLRKDGSLLGFGSYDIHGGERKRVLLTLPPGFRLIDIQSGTVSYRADTTSSENTSTGNTSPGQERRVIELWDNLPQHIDVIFEGEIPVAPSRDGAGRSPWENGSNACTIPLPVFEGVPVAETLWTLCFETSPREILPRFSVRPLFQFQAGNGNGGNRIAAGSNGNGDANFAAPHSAFTRVSNSTENPPANGNRGRNLFSEERLIDEAFLPEIPLSTAQSSAALVQLRLARLENLLRLTARLPSSTSISGLDLRRWHSHWGERWWEIRAEVDITLDTLRDPDTRTIGRGIPIAASPNTPILIYLDSVSPPRQTNPVAATRLFTSALNRLDQTHRLVLDNFGLIPADRQIQEGNAIATAPLAIWSKSHFEREARLFGLAPGTLTGLTVQSHPAPKRLIDSVPFHYGIWAIVVFLGAALTVRSPIRRFYRRFPHFIGIAIGILIWVAAPQSGAGAILILLSLAAFLSSPWRKSSKVAEKMSAAHWSG